MSARPGTIFRDDLEGTARCLSTSPGVALDGSLMPAWLALAAAEGPDDPGPLAVALPVIGYGWWPDLPGGAVAAEALVRLAAAAGLLLSQARSALADLDAAAAGASNDAEIQAVGDVADVLRLLVAELDSGVPLGGSPAVGDGGPPAVGPGASG